MQYNILIFYYFIILLFPKFICILVNKNGTCSIESLKQQYVDYFRSKLTIKDTCDFNSRLLGISNDFTKSVSTIIENSERDLLEVHEPVNKLLFHFRNNEKSMINLIENVKSSEDMEDLVNFLGHFYFDNILTQKPETDELLTLIFLLMEKEIDSLNTPSVSSFLDRSFLGRFLKSLTRRQDIKSYLAMTLGDLI